MAPTRSTAAGHRPSTIGEHGEAGRRGAADAVDRQGQGDGRQLVLGLGLELAVPGRERLLLDGAVHEQLLDHRGALDRAAGTVDGRGGRPDGVLLEDQAGDVLGPVDR
jgi:hypothetical protein